MRILLIVHGYPPTAQGGTEIHTRSLARNLSLAGHELFILSRRAEPEHAEYHIFRREEGGVRVFEINNNFAAITSFQESYRNHEIARIAAEIIEDLQPDIAHIQHLTCLSTEIPRILAARGIPVVFTLNDYWLLCHRGQLFDTELKRCSGPSLGGCARCIEAHAGLPDTAFRAASVLRRVERLLPEGLARGLRRRATRSLQQMTSLEHARSEAERRRNAIEKLIEHVDVFLTPSQTLHEIFLRAGFPQNKLRMVSQGIETGLFSDLNCRPSSRFRLGFLGSLIVSKAPDVLLQAFRLLSEGSAELHIWGSIGEYHGDNSYAEIIEPLLEGPGIIRHGFVPHEKIAEIFASIDCLVIPSIWIENAPFVIREAFAAGVPVVASDIGGMAEMVEDGVSGLHFKAGDAKDLARQLRRLIDERNLLGRLRTGIPKMPSIGEYCGGLEAIYREFLSPRNPRPRLAAVILNYGNAGDTRLAIRSLRSSQRPVDEILVVDNASGDDSIPRLQSISGITLLSNEKNLGFSGGCNTGIRAALENGADSIFLLNSDAIVSPETLGLLEAAMRADERIGIVGAIVLHRSRPTRVASAGIDFSIATGRMKHRKSGLHWKPGLFDTLPVDAVAGCAMLVTRRTFEEIGLLDVDYFFFFEEIAFCLKAKRRGWKTLLVGDAVAYHAGSQSIGPNSALRFYYATRNHLLAAQREAPLPWPLAGFRAILIFSYNLLHALISPGRRLLQLRFVFQGLLDYLRGRNGAMSG